MIFVFICANCNKRTRLNCYKKPKFCRRIDCMRERHRNQNRYTPRITEKSNRKISSGISCQLCGRDTGPNRYVCPSCNRNRSGGIL
jgi:hypothetical protein